MELLNPEKYLNFTFIELQELKGKLIKDTFTNTYENYSFIVTEDNELSGYILRCFSNSYDDNDDSVSHKIYPLTYQDVIQFVMSNPYNYEFIENQLIQNPEGLHQAILEMEIEEQNDRLQSMKKERYPQYLRLKKEFEPQRGKGEQD